MSTASRKYLPHPRNAPGPFYVEKGCCTLCHVPAYAPLLFEVDAEQERHCWVKRVKRVKRQPTIPAELDQMLEIIHMSDLGCIRYGGADPDIIERLKAMNAADTVDALSSAPEL